MRKQLLISICLILGGVHVQAQNNKKADAQDAALIAELRKNSRKLKIENKRLTGEGARFLLDEARAAQFFLIGEDHGFADLPIFTETLFRAVYGLGYQAFATETGPLTADYLFDMASAPQPQKAFSDFNAQYPFGLPFYNWKEEAQMAETIVKTAGGRKQVLWGLDQEFIASSAFHFKRLAALASREEEKAIAAEYYEKTKDEFARIVKSRNPTLAFLTSAKTEDFDRLDNAFKNSSREAKTILSELRTSWEIYRKSTAGQNYESNLQRSLLMKKHFMAYYNAVLNNQKAPPKVLFKFGSNHLGRGRTSNNVYDIGNFVAELAAANDSTSFHLFAIPTSGRQNKYLPFLENVADKQKRFNANGYRFDMKPFLEIAGDEDWTVIDFRPLRPLLHGRRPDDLPRGFADLVWSWDAILLMPNAKAAALFEQ